MIFLIANVLTIRIIDSYVNNVQNKTNKKSDIT